jgi:putative restriction endonuclease
MESTDQDAQLRQVAFSHVNRLATLRGGVLDSADLAGGFEFDGERIPLINPQRGILQAPSDGTPVEHQDGLPEKGCSGLV